MKHAPPPGATRFHVMYSDDAHVEAMALILVSFAPMHYHPRWSMPIASPLESTMWPRRRQVATPDPRLSKKPECGNSTWRDAREARAICSQARFTDRATVPSPGIWELARVKLCRNRRFEVHEPGEPLGWLCDHVALRHLPQPVLSPAMEDGTAPHWRPASAILPDVVGSPSWADIKKELDESLRYVRQDIR